ncbi:hypothetical protein ACH4UM_39850 [Streptomyces sp. NPDC020801]|uniref:hypothetical protein n=1 Tax=Streptomyces sp. NPDC020801 TaxID=3365093 RepID=UPI00378AC339
MRKTGETAAQAEADHTGSEVVHCAVLTLSGGLVFGRLQERKTLGYRSMLAEVSAAVT